MKKLVASIALLAFASIAPANAADLYGGSSKMQPSTPVVVNDMMNWAGLEIGVQGGWRLTNHDVDVSAHDEDESFNLFNLNAIGGDGLYGRLIAGYTFRVGNDWYTGVRGYYGISDTSTTFSAINGLVKAEIEGGQDYGGDVIIGRAVGSDKSTLIFGSVGYKWAEYDLSASYNGKSIPLDKVGIDSSLDVQGFTFGGGVKHAFTKNLIGSVEYVHFMGDTEDLSKIKGLSVKDTLRSDEILVGLHYHF